MKQKNYNTIISATKDIRSEIGLPPSKEIDWENVMNVWILRTCTNSEPKLGDPLNFDPKYTWSDGADLLKNGAELKENQILMYITKEKKYRICTTTAYDHFKYELLINKHTVDNIFVHIHYSDILKHFMLGVAARETHTRKTTR
jgi:hypothetical protein